jgi:uncharacterized membrane protein
MKLKKLALTVMLCWIISLLVTLARFQYPHVSYAVSIATILLRDGSMIVFLAFLYARSS